MDRVLAQIPLPGCRVDEHPESIVHVLLWVRDGAATVRLDGQSHRLGAQQALWIPADHARMIDVDPGSVVLPVFVPTDMVGADRADVRVIDVPEPWRKRLMHFFALGVLPRLRTGSVPSELLRLVEEPAVPRAPMPRSRAAAEVARELARHPGSSRTIEEWAQWANVSTSALRRSFAEETGLTFQQWRIRCRLDIAADHLSNARQIDWTAHETGYTPKALSRAFRARFGLPPGAFAKQHEGLGNDRSLDKRVLEGLLPGRQSSAGTDQVAAPLPVASTPWLVHEFSVLYWVHRGVATFRLDGRNVVLTVREAIWLPPRLRYAMRVHEDSIVLPVGFRWEVPGEGHRNVGVVRFPARLEKTLLYTAVATHTKIRPPDYDLSAFMRVFENHLASRGALAEPDARTDGAVSTIVTAIWRDPGDKRHLSQWAATLNVEPATLATAFQQRFGATFRQWRASVRMSAACELLRTGTQAHVIARRMGYAHLSGFSRIFTQVHGMSPREYQSTSRLAHSA